MSTSIFILLVVQIILIILNAIFASAEIAVLSMNETKLERMAEQGNGRAKRLVRLTQEPARFLATIQVAITLSGFLGSAFAADNFSEPLVDWVVGMGVNIPRSTLDTIAVILITLILSYFTLVFGELVPKRIAMKKSEELAMGISGLVTGISILFKPIVSFLSISTNIVLRICGIDPNEAEDQVGEEEICMLVDAGSEKGTIDHQEKEFIQNVFEFNDITVSEIMTHRTDIFAVDMNIGMDELLHEIEKSDYKISRIPVFDETIDDIKGILYLKDVLKNIHKKTFKVKNIMKDAYFVPQNKLINELFKELQKNKTQMAIILDEYGGTAGLITMEDILEELVGDIYDEYDDIEEEFEK